MINNVNINFQIYCTRPGWSVSKEITRYRIYVDNDLITERTWIWGNDTALHENIYVKINLEQDHILKVEPIIRRPDQAFFELHYPRSEGKEFVVIKAITPLELLFRIA